MAYVNQPIKRSLCQVLAARTRTSYNINRGLCQSTHQANNAERGRQEGCGHVIRTNRKLLRASPGQNLINVQLEYNRNFKETAQGQPKLESHQFSIRM